MENINIKTPVLVVTEERWGCGYVVFAEDDKKELIPEEWIQSRVDEYNADEEMEKSYSFEEVAEEMLNEFFAENSDVDEFWPDLGVLRCGNSFYSYNDDGEEKYLGEFDTLEDYQTWASL